MWDQFPDQGSNPGPPHWGNRVLASGPLGESRAVFREWFALVGHMHKGWVGSGTKENGVQTHSPRGLWTRGTDRQRGRACHRAGFGGPVTLSHVRNPLVPPTDTGDPGSQNTTRQNMLDAFF